MDELTGEEEMFNAEVSAAIEEHLVTARYGDLLASEGVTTVALDEAGRLIEYRPDGTSTVLPDIA